MVVNGQRMKINPCIWTLGFMVKAISYLFGIVGVVIMTLAVQMYSRHREDDDLHDVKQYWFEIVFASMGALAFLTGFTGVAGADCGSQCCLALHITLLIVLGLLEAVVLLDWRYDFLEEALPDDETHEWTTVHDFIQTYVQWARAGSLVLLALQVASLLLALLTIHLEGRMRLTARFVRMQKRTQNGQEESAPLLEDGDDHEYQWQKE